MKSLIYTYILIISLFVQTTKGQENPVEKGLGSINSEVIKAQTGFLSSDWTEGRAAGERGERLAGDYIASMLQLYGVKPFGDKEKTKAGKSASDEPGRTYFQNFILLKTLPGDEQVMQIRSAEGKSVITTFLTMNVDFTIRATDPAFEITAPVVFAGYAFRNDEFKYNDFAKLDVKGKFILRISGIPRFIADKMNESERYRATLRMDSAIKAMGAIGIIEFSPEKKVVGTPEIPDFMNMSPSEGIPTTGKPRASYSIPGEKTSSPLKRINVSVKSANEILKGSGIEIDDYLLKADQNQSYQFTQITNKDIFIKTSIKISQIAVRNIIGIIEGMRKDQFIVLGAHYDHMGSGNGYTWNGADDNASGTVGVMTIARAIMETGVQPEKSIIVALWSSEELGLLGSKYYLDNLEFQLSNIKLNLNFDMISRYISESEPDKVTMTYSDNCPFFMDLTVSNLKKYNIALNVDYQPSKEPPGGSDHRSFVAKGIPVMRFKPGHREEYHTPNDEIGKLNWDIMEKIIKISFANVWQLSNSEWQSK
jgi:hypothetical protein